jgi:parallel beta-helix repeat protein
MRHVLLWLGKMRGTVKYTVTICTLLLFQLFFTINIVAEIAENNISIHKKYDFIVDKSGNGDFTSIQQAIDYAHPGSTVYVRAGVYSEVIEIKKSLSLIGEDKESTLINPISDKNKYAVYLGASNIFVSGFTIINGAPGLYSQGIRIVSSYNKISNCNIYDTPIGIAIWRSNNIIENCVFSGCNDEGIALLGSINNPVNNNTITNCIFYNNLDAIEIQYASGNTISNCEIYENTHSGINAIASNNNNNTISNCKIYDNGIHGIYFSHSKGNRIINSEVQNNAYDDIVINKYSSYNEIIHTQNNQTSEFFKELFFKSFLEFFSNVRKELVPQIMDRIIF